MRKCIVKKDSCLRLGFCCCAKERNYIDLRLWRHGSFWCWKFATNWLLQPEKLLHIQFCSRIFLLLLVVVVVVVIAVGKLLQPDYAALKAAQKSILSPQSLLCRCKTLSPSVQLQLKQTSVYVYIENPITAR